VLRNPFTKSRRQTPSDQVCAPTTATADLVLGIFANREVAVWHIDLRGGEQSKSWKAMTG
jgi:hypothetical protein